MVLSDTIERIYVFPYYAEENLGLYIIRGENIQLYGEWDDEKDAVYLARESLVDYSPKMDLLALESHPRSSISNLENFSRASQSHIHASPIHAFSTNLPIHALPLVEGWKREEDMTVLRLRLKEKVEELKQIDRMKKQLKKEYGILEAEIMADFE